jgi:hypothetical protein
VAATERRWRWRREVVAEARGGVGGARQRINGDNGGTAR